MVNALIKPGSIALPVTYDGQNSKDWLKEVKIPQPSKEADQFRSKGQEETQRFTRRSQFPENPSPRTTSKRANSQIVNWQLERVRLRLKTEEEQKPDTVPNKSKIFDKAINQDKEKDARKQARRLVESLNSWSVMPMERPKEIIRLATQAILSEEPIMIVNWVCPAGTPLMVTPDGNNIYRRFIGVDPLKGILADYRLIPRLDQERKLIETFKRFRIPFWYLKIVADDNLNCVYPDCLKVDGEPETRAAVVRYAKEMQMFLDERLGKDNITVLTMSQVLGPERFQQLLNTFTKLDFESLEPFLPAGALETEIDVIAKHTKIDPTLEPLISNFAMTVIRQYSAEGLMLSGTFGDNVILAWNESTRRYKTVDAARNLKGLSALPKVFVLYERQGNQIINNF